MRTTITITAKIDYTTAQTKKEKLMTLQEFFDMGRAKPGQQILIGQVNGDQSTNTQTIHIGDELPFVDMDNYDDVKLALFVLEILEIE